MFLGSNMHMMTQTVEEGDSPCLPHRLSVMNTFTKMITRSKLVAVVVKNLTAALITITKAVKIAGVVAAKAILQVKISPATLEKLDKMQGIQRYTMSVEKRRETLFQQLDLSGLEGWSPQNCAATHTLLAEYHGIFSLEPGELGSTNLAKHEIKVTDDEPFKGRFQRIPPPMVDEVHSHVKKMLEVAAIHPSQICWCNAIVLVSKKERGLHFCIDFHKLNMRTKKDSYPLP